MTLVFTVHAYLREIVSSGAYHCNKVSLVIFSLVENLAVMFCKTQIICEVQ